MSNIENSKDKLIIDNRPLNEQINHNYESERLQALEQNLESMEQTNKSLIKKLNIWKDPKVELPKNHRFGEIESESIFIVIGNNWFDIVEYIENRFVKIDYSCDMVIKDYTDYTITKWAYCKDLIKQAGDE
ncbi:MAG: hypothetical protein Unbinned6284contig1004_52 [Prokaryotic dsDNA virus sp.]|nr:MAG: hypothetical protein Unbinned6284contig1004_52 [Prokaryotic dsDNA virus sp.]|tara:strand:+ start:9536 stop:9928 length:393 start_codon:yes stop_codon:yes gene_type:complete